MMIAYFALALVAGVACGAAMGYEMRHMSGHPRPGRAWLVLVGVAIVVATCAVMVENLNRSSPASTLVQGLSAGVVILGFIVAFLVVRSKS
jgi:hypothetical protein